MSGDMEQTGEAQVSYRLDDKEQEEFIQWFGRSFLRRKRDAQLAGMNFQTYPRPDVSNLKEDTKIRMESDVYKRQSCIRGAWRCDACAV